MTLANFHLNHRFVQERSTGRHHEIKIGKHKRLRLVIFMLAKRVD